MARVGVIKRRNVLCECEKKRKLSVVTGYGGSTSDLSRAHRRGQQQRFPPFLDLLSRLVRTYTRIFTQIATS